MIPGEILPIFGDIGPDADRPVTRLTVANTGDRPIPAGGRDRFAKIALVPAFNRVAKRGHRLDIAAAIRFEPGQSHEAALPPHAGGRIVMDFRGDVMGPP